MDNIIHYYTIQVIAILVEDCQSFRDCTSCTGLGDPLCGWCSIENKCSRRSECSNYNETRRWIQDQSMCIANFDILPNTHPVEMIDQQLQVVYSCRRFFVFSPNNSCNIIVNYNLFSVFNFFSSP